jgi:hypothetical protein
LGLASSTPAELKGGGTPLLEFFVAPDVTPLGHDALGAVVSRRPDALRNHHLSLPRITRRILQVRAVPIGTVLVLRTTPSLKCAAVPRRARI